MDFKAMRYFRQLPGAEELTSPELILEVRSALARREVVIELEEILGEVAPDFTERASEAGDIGVVAARVRRWLGVDGAEAARWKSEHEALQGWRSAFERRGILVSQVSGVNVSEMRGLSVFEKRHPIVMINGRDSPRARCFTLFHELGHLLLRAHAVCDLNEGTHGPEGEVFCNRFAGETLVPPKELVGALAQRSGESPGSDDVLEMLARQFWVSREVMLRRLRDLGRVSSAYYEHWKRQREREAPPPRPRGFAPVHRRVVARTGRHFVRLVLDAYHQEAITGSDLADLLGVNMKHLPAIERMVTEMADIKEAS